MEGSETPKSAQSSDFQSSMKIEDSMEEPMAGVKMETAADARTPGETGDVGDTQPTSTGNGVSAAAPSMVAGSISADTADLSKVKSIDPANTTTGPGAGAGASGAALKVGKTDQTHRIDIDSAMTRFQRKLGRNWDKYRDTITHFLMGKLSRPELTSMLSSFLTPLEARTHNYLLLAILANSLREPPPGEGGLSGWKTRGTTRKTNVDTPTELLHREIMALPARERKRIKNIARENKRPNVPIPQPCLIATRQAMLPHLPYVQDRGSQTATARTEARTNGATPNAANSGASAAAAAAASAAAAGGASGRRVKPEPPSGAAAGTAPAQSAGTVAGSGGRALPPQRGLKPKPGAPRPEFASPPPPDSEIIGADGTVLNSGRLSGPLTWTQDIIHGFEAPLAGELYELPDDDSISERVLGIALEHGVTNGYEAGVTDVILAGVEQYLTTILSTLAPLCRNRSVSPTEPITARDMQTMFIQHAGRFRELYGPLYRISTHYLQDEETATEADLDTQSDSVPELEIADSKAEVTDATTDTDEQSIWSIEPRPRKRTAQEAALLQDSLKGKQFVRQLLSMQ